MALDTKQPKGYRKAWNGGQPPPDERVLYVCAVNFEEARQLADRIGHRTRKEAEEHLREIQQLPTDPFYAKQYRIFIVSSEGTAGATKR